MTTEHKEVGFTKVLTDGKLDFIICHGCSKHLDISNIERQAKADRDKEIFDNKNIINVIQDAHLIYQKHKVKKGESWKELNIVFLEKKLDEKIKEFKESYAPKEYEELLDVINVALMLAVRLKEIKTNQAIKKKHLGCE